MMTMDPDFLARLSLNNEENGELWEVHLDEAGKLSLTSSCGPGRSIVFDADAVLTLLVYLQEHRETIALHAEQHRMIDTDLS